MEGDRGSVEGQRRHHAQASSTVLAAQGGGRGLHRVWAYYILQQSHDSRRHYGDAWQDSPKVSYQAHPLAQVSTQSEIQPSKGLTAHARIIYPVGS